MVSLYWTLAAEVVSSHNDFSRPSREYWFEAEAQIRAEYGEA